MSAVLTYFIPIAFAIVILIFLVKKFNKPRPEKGETASSGPLFTSDAGLEMISITSALSSKIRDRAIQHAQKKGIDLISKRFIREIYKEILVEESRK
ncbi:MAG: hypothetical protein HYT03_02895 [Candidatus Harrisonbacteria bacterium]|nr:hypothetical protein [Candidatus Harrisonbacteria bacterium]